MAAHREAGGAAPRPARAPRRAHGGDRRRPGHWARTRRGRGAEGEDTGRLPERSGRPPQGDPSGAGGRGHGGEPKLHSATVPKWCAWRESNPLPCGPEFSASRWPASPWAATPDELVVLPAAGPVERHEPQQRPPATGACEPFVSPGNGADTRSRGSAHRPDLIAIRRSGGSVRPDRPISSPAHALALSDGVATATGCDAGALAAEGAGGPGGPGGPSGPAGPRGAGGPTWLITAAGILPMPATVKPRQLPANPKISATTATSPRSRSWCQWSF